MLSGVMTAGITWLLAGIDLPAPAPAHGTSAVAVENIYYVQLDGMT